MDLLFEIDLIFFFFWLKENTRHLNEISQILLRPELSFWEVEENRLISQERTGIMARACRTEMSGFHQTKWGFHCSPAMMLGFTVSALLLMAMGDNPLVGQGEEGGRQERREVEGKDLCP